MKSRYFFIALLLCLCANAEAEWFLRGSHNAWVALQMNSAGAGTNTMQLNGVVFGSAGSIKFDRFGDWKENYGVGGLNGSNIPVAAGTWNIKFFTDTKNWNISPAVPVDIPYHIRGTFNAWAEGTLMIRIGATDNYERCINFTGGDSNGGPRFKIDPNGNWGDAIPAADFVVLPGWVRVAFNSTSKIINVQQNMAPNCGEPNNSSSQASSNLSSSGQASSNLSSSLQASSDPAASSQASSDLSASSIGASSLAASSVAASSLGASSLGSSASSAPTSIYHLRGTFNAWAEGTFMLPLGGDLYERCVNFTGGDSNGGPRFKIDPNGNWGDAIPAADFVVSSGWVRINFNSSSKAITVQQNLAANCGQTGSSSLGSSSSSTASNIYHLRGTFNAWAEGTFMLPLGGDNYERCVNFTGGDSNGGPRFKIDPNGNWGDAIPAADFPVSIGWVRITFNSGTKAINVQQNLTPNCGGQPGSSSQGSSLGSSSSSIASSIYHLRGTFNAWAEGTFMLPLGGDLYERCVNFTGGDANGGPRFKIDPNGGWMDAVPAADFVVSQGWVKINFNSSSKAITVQQNLAPNCGQPGGSSSLGSSSPGSSSLGSSSSSAQVTSYHLRGTFNSWAEGTLMSEIGTTNTYEQCVNFINGDSKGGPRFKIDPNGGWVDALPQQDFNVSPGWVKISFNAATKVITAQENLPTNCGSQVFHLRGTHNGWAEGDLFASVDNIQPLWTICRNFGPAGANNPRFKVDPSGGWGPDAFPAADVLTSGWTSILIDGVKVVTLTKDMLPNCGAP
ncbi:MAG TPA: hypothetical protein VN030_08510 [Cellvibrio sp.]|nr:hypothetical protein [Cellvibrio sp.]